MIRIYPRHSADVRYYTEDRARELEGTRPSPGWWLRGDGDSTDRRVVASVLRHTERSSVVGYDLVVAAPRPVSVLLAIDESAGPGLVRAHREAVAGALRYLEERAVMTRVRRGGRDAEVPARWESVVSFTHGVNRHGDPHVHDHVLVGSLPADADTALDRRSLLAHRDAADAIYRSQLRAGVTERLGRRAWRTFSGAELVEGVDEGYRILFGGHHAERGVKFTGTRDDVRAMWARSLERYEPGPLVTAPDRVVDVHSFAGHFEGRTVISRRDIVVAWANSWVFGRSGDLVGHDVDRGWPELAATRGLHERSVTLDRARTGTRELERERDRHRELERQRDRVDLGERSRAR